MPDPLDEEGRKTLNRAKEILMNKHGMTEPIAYHTIRILAMRRQVTRAAVAEELIRTYDN